MVHFHELFYNEILQKQNIKAKKHRKPQYYLKLFNRQM